MRVKESRIIAQQREYKIAERGLSPYFHLYRWRVATRRMLKKKYMPSRYLSLGIAVLLLISVSLFFVLFGANKPNKALGHITASPTTTRLVSPTVSLTPLPLFTDHFTSESSGWYVGDTGGYKRMLSSNGLLLSDTNHQILIESLPTGIHFDNFVLTTTFTLMQASANDSVGLYVRGDVNLDHDYRIDIFGNKSYGISKETLDAQRNPHVIVLVPPTHTLLLKPLGQSNTLKVTMNGLMLVVEINGKLAASISDADYTRGQIALFVSNSATSPGVTALLSSVTVSALPAAGQP